MVKKTHSRKPRKKGHHASVTETEAKKNHCNCGCVHKKQSILLLLGKQAANMLFNFIFQAAIKGALHLL
ncbi:hypothetical protein LX64_04159 [Chitinophaga skermanii]|uniref:Uncharacterized protein n=1 Tax=Chitinophaga skermanii TaxID=331697 RepID=A0A327QB74_9BACT|nr:hypothetical protein LX64_04159 [Chitinophaga skermanii]